MKREAKPTKIWRRPSAGLLILTATLSACAQPGDFCVVVAAPITFAPETATAIVATDRPSAEAVRVQNEYWARHCT